MDKSPLARIDLNLLVALRALIRTRQVTQAARSIGITQPAMSRALGRLRTLFQDPLLVRARGGYELSHRAESLAPELERCLAGIEELLSTTAFDPRSAQHSFKLCTTDFGTLFYVPYLLELVQARAPGIDVNIRHWDKHSLQLIERGEVDLAMAILVDPPHNLRSLRMGSDQLVCVYREGHPLGADTLTLDGYCDYQHINIPHYADDDELPDRQLAELGRSRHVAVELPHFVAALNTVSQTDLLLTLPRLFARTMIGSFRLPLLIRPMPLQLPRIHYCQIWHERAHHDPAHRWLRQTMIEGFRDEFRGMVRVFAEEIRLDGGLGGDGGPQEDNP